METTIQRTVAESLAAQFTEDTGRHILDSGGAYGRGFERLAGMTAADFEALPAVTVDPEYGDVSVSLFHVLRQHLSVTPDTVELTRRFRAYVESTPKGEAYYNSADSVEEFLDGIGAERSRTDNTYNYETLADGVVQYVEFTLDADQYIALSTHNGADVRGGYSDYVIYRACDCWLYGLVQGSVVCRMCNSLFNVSLFEVTDSDGLPVELGERGLSKCPACKWNYVEGDTIGECFS